MENVSRMDKPKLAGYGIMAISTVGIAYKLYPLFSSNPVATVVLGITGLFVGLHLVRG